MEDLELQQLWQQLNEAKILNAQSWALNLQNFTDNRQQKASRKLHSLIRFKISAVVLGIIWVLLLGTLAWSNHFANPYFTVSLIILVAFSLYALIIYIIQVIQIRQISYEHTIVDTQNTLAALQSSTLRSTSVLWLQMPFYSTWFWNNEWISGSAYSFWCVAFPVTILLSLLAIHLYRNIASGNMHKKWVKTFMMMGPEYKNIVQSIAFMGDIQEFRKELV